MKHKILIILIFILIFACKERVKPKSETILSGVVVPSSSGAEIIVLEHGKEVKRTFIDPINGSFHIKLSKGGVYDIKILPQTLYAPLYIRNINVKENEINSLKTITIPSISEKGIIYGVVIPKDALPLIKIYKEDKEVASVKASPEDGKFVISNLPYGKYNIEIISSEGYTNFSIKEVSLKKNSNKINIEAILLYKTDIGGIDWDKGIITGVGYATPSQNMKEEELKRMAIKDCNKNLASIIKEVRLSPDKKIGDIGIPLSDMENFFKKAEINSERFLDDGRYELSMTISLNELINFIKRYIEKEMPK
jgi:translation initiation factor IF-3